MHYGTLEDLEHAQKAQTESGGRSRVATADPEVAGLPAAEPRPESDVIRHVPRRSPLGPRPGLHRERVRGYGVWLAEKRINTAALTGRPHLCETTRMFVVVKDK